MLCFRLTGLKSVHILKATWLDKKPKYWYLYYLRKSDIGFALIYVPCGRTLGSGSAFRGCWERSHEATGKLEAWASPSLNLNRSQLLQASVFLLVNSLVPLKSGPTARTWPQTAPVKGWHRLALVSWRTVAGLLLSSRPHQWICTERLTTLSNLNVRVLWEPFTLIGH